MTTTEEAIKTLKENCCAMCAYGSQNMDSCDIRGCDNRDAIKALEQELCWIPISEKLPEEGKDVLIQYKTNVGDYMAVSRIFDRNYWVDFGRDVCVTAWKPSPEPYKAESEDKR